MQTSIVDETSNVWSNSLPPSKEIVSISSEHSPRKHRNGLFHTQHDSNSNSESGEEDSDDASQSVVLEVKNVHKTYLLGLEGVPAIRGVDLCVHRGEFVIIVGKSGSGKSSLLNILGTVDSPTRGELSIAGYTFHDKVSDRIVSQIRLNAIGFVFQTFNLIPGMTAAQNIELPLILKGELTRSQRREAVDELLQRVGMAERRDHYPSQLSGGEQQRVSIARGLANSPDLLLLDEPTGDLDTLNTIRIMNLLVELNNMGTTLVMVTHDMQLPSIATRVIVMSDGKVKDVLENSDEKRFQALQQLNNGIEDLSVFEMGNASVDSSTYSTPTEVRKPENYDREVYGGGIKCLLLIMKVDCLVYVLLVFFVVCTMVSIVVMNKEVTAPYMDEIFHFSMTQNYLEGNYTYWDPKITTFPGLYVIGTLYCKLYSLFFATGDAGCSLSALRWMNMLFLYLTAFSVYQIIHFLHPANRVKSYLWTIQVMSVPTILDAYFLYYTDGVSLYFASTSILFAILSDRGNKYGFIILSALFSSFAVFCRQTNIILSVLNPALILLLRYGLVWKSEKYAKFGTQIIHLLSLIFSEFQFVLRLAIPYLVLFISFVVFFVKNGFSVVLGDREHHSMSLHLMQLCYFSVFFCLVGIATSATPKRSTKRCLVCIFSVCFCLFCFHFAADFTLRFVEKFTFIHPFIRSDNRHFVFYIFKDIVIVLFPFFFLKSQPFKYFLIPIYAASLLGMVRELLSSVTSLLVLVSGVLFALILVSSPLVECDSMEFASVDFGIIRSRFCFTSALSALARTPLFRLRFLSRSI
ncbi:uncharacterized protein [Blastocystis hominis]|uniref:Dol-P-Glc:Glc(2)Man(9)GlcNAc(2)-PP-Dol alpha-1,2-glucosyltransferase n=1 Tax=Blastocystis hominis TaxID=12968 RepID=D8M4Q5_BLAHO|nr:uncharacterized protein [Blastocystis hominis]CBK23044.2 unnamed protein product [Blastocystis hominis]|eukprot:XP_012897092.1 uncharacterized protein [Blastocystis hominis]